MRRARVGTSTEQESRGPSQCEEGYAESTDQDLNLEQIEGPSLLSEHSRLPISN